MVAVVRWLRILPYLLASLASGNDGSFFGVGSAVVPMSEHRVRMVAETVVIAHDPQAGRDAWRTHATAWSATCDFVFESLDDEPVEVLMGFPDSFDTEDSGVSPDAHGFRAWVRGEEVGAARVEIAPGPDDGGPGWQRFDAAWTWRVRFGPRERVVVRNRYRFGGTASNGPIDGCLLEKDAPAGVASEAWWGGLHAAPCRDLPGDGTCTSVHYVVRTGRTWAGPIGRADIAIELPPGTLAHEVLALPAATRIEGGVVRWRFENWTPERDLVLVASPRTPYPSDPGCRAERTTPRFALGSQAEATAWVAWARRNGVGRDAARLVRNALFAERGHRPRDPALRQAFEATTWWPHIPAEPEPLAPEDWRIVATIRRYEDSLSARR